MRPARVLGFTATIAALVLGPSSASACSCIYPTVEEARERSVLVVSGEVLALEAIPPQNDPAPWEPGWLVTFRIEDRWKGDPDSTGITIWTAASTAACGVEFVTGLRYLVYSDRLDEVGYWAHLCSRTRPLQYAQEDLDILGPPLDPSSTRSGSWGLIKTRYR